MSAKTKGEEINIRARAVDYKLRTLLNKSYTLRTGYGTLQKAGPKSDDKQRKRIHLRNQ